jgi:hypothetical protein
VHKPAHDGPRQQQKTRTRGPLVFGGPGRLPLPPCPRAGPAAAVGVAGAAVAGVAGAATPVVRGCESWWGIRRKTIEMGERMCGRKDLDRHGGRWRVGPAAVGHVFGTRGGGWMRCYPSAERQLFPSS